MSGKHLSRKSGRFSKNLSGGGEGREREESQIGIVDGIDDGIVESWGASVGEVKNLWIRKESKIEKELEREKEREKERKRERKREREKEKKVMVAGM